jgi:hypothetical protein
VDETHYPRGSIHPVNGGDDGNEGEPGKRAMSFAAPNGTPSTYRHTFHYILPFDPQASEGLIGQAVTRIVAALQETGS